MTNLDTSLKADEDQEPEYQDILGNGSFMKKVLKAGTDIKPEDQNIINITYEEYINTSPLNHTDNFDNFKFVETKNVTYTIGDNEIIPLFDIGVKLMGLHEKSEFLVESRFAYDKFGKPSHNIPPDANMRYVITLNDIKPPLNYADLSCSEILDHSKSKKERGNFWFKRADYTYAIDCYSKGLDILTFALDQLQTDEVMMVENSKELTQQKQFEKEKLNKAYQKLYCELHNNIAECQLKVKAYNACLKSLSNVFICDPWDLKALWRQIKAYEGLNQIEQALEVIEKCLTNENGLGSNENSSTDYIKFFASERNRLRALYSQEINDCKKLYRNMCQDLTHSIDNNLLSTDGNDELETNYEKNESVVINGKNKTGVLQMSPNQMHSLKYGLKRFIDSVNCKFSLLKSAPRIYILAFLILLISGLVFYNFPHHSYIKS